MVPATSAARAAANLAAIKLLATLGDRPATVDEQGVLAGWSGWGAVPAVFDAHNTTFTTARARLRGLLSEAEWHAAARTTINAHYTDPVIVDQMWRLLDQLGVPADGRVLEPGCGSGNFIGAAPAGTAMVGVELDPVTARVAAKLYPSADIRSESFADTRDLGGVDATIGNVPFGKVVLHDPAYNTGRHSLHNHFLVKALAMTNPGGVVAVLTSRYTLDATDAAAREEMAGLAELVTAYRLPSGAHRRTAGTDAVTDLVVFRRHDRPAEPGPRPDWLDTTTVTVDGDSVTMNAYLATRPDQVFGTVGVGHGLYGKELVVHADPGELSGRLERAVDETAELVRRRPELRWRRWDSPTPPPVDPTADVPGRLRLISPTGIEQTDKRTGGPREGARDRTTGFEQTTSGGWVSASVPASQTAELTQLVRIRDRYLAVLDADAGSTVDTAGNRELRAALNDAYDNYRDRFGPINRYTETPSGRVDRLGEPVRVRRYPPAVTRFRRDPDSVYVRALEVFDDQTQTATKAAILRGRVLSAREPAGRADTPADAVALCLDRHGELRAATIAALSSIAVAEVPAVLGDLAYTEPGSNRLVPAAEYLSGRVRDKLATARAAAADDPVWQRNVTALLGVQPVDLQPGEIKAALGAAWIGPGDVQAFLRETLRDPFVQVERDPTGGWKVTGGNRWTVQATDEWGVKDLPAHRICQSVLNQIPIRVTVDGPDGTRVDKPDATAAARAKGEAMNDRFAAWVWEDPARAARLADHYNALFNAVVLRRDYRFGPMALPGLASTFTPAEHQLNAVARVIQEGSAGVFHPVGFGKTAVMVMAIMEQRRLGLVTKPAMVVPNHMLEQAQREFLQLYPAARIVAATSEDLSRDRRRLFVAKVTNGDWDAVIMTRSAFAALPVSAEELRRYLDDEVGGLRRAFQAQCEAGDRGSRSVKQAEQALLQLEEKIKAKLDSRRDLGVSFEQTGIDYVAVDELHDFKNLTTPSRIPGAGIAAGSQRATDLHQKVSYLRRTHDGRAILGATATPISNSVSEVYVMLRHLSPDLLTAAGINTFDDWAATFGRTVTTIELAPAGETFRESTRFARFQNVPELLSMWAAAGDTVDPTQVTLPRPQLVARADGQRSPQKVQVPASDYLIALNADLADRAQKVRGHGVDSRDDNMLKITSEGRLAALDLRLTPQHTGMNLQLGVPTKVDVAAANLHRIWTDHQRQVFVDPATGEPHPRPGALQLVFCDLGTPKADGAFSVYTELRNQLIDRGIPADQIAFTHDARTDADKGRLFARARSGDVQVLIGSTQMMGVGTNVQHRAIALHHLDCPWKPAEMEQREGRILRQGNQHPEVMIYRYATERSFDGYMYQTVARKAGFIDQVMAGRVDAREIDDISTSETLSYEEMQAAISGNPHLREKLRIDTEIHQLELLARSHRDADRTLAWRIRDMTSQLTTLDTTVIPGLTADRARLIDTRGDQFSFTIDGRRYHDRSDAAVVLGRRLAHLTGPDQQHIGELAGLTVTAARVRLLDRPGVRLTLSQYGKPVAFDVAELPGLTSHHIQRLENAAAALPHQLRDVTTHRAELIDQLDRAAARHGQPFPHQERLDQLRHEQATINQAITEQLRPRSAPSSAPPQAPEARLLKPPASRPRTAPLESPPATHGYRPRQ